MAHPPRIRAALFRHLIEQSSVSLSGSAIGALLVAAAQYFQFDNRVEATAWLTLILLTFMFRAWLVRVYRERIEAIATDDQALTRLALSTSLSGIAWGVGGVIFLSDDPLAMVITITAVHAMVMGSGMTLGACLPAFLAYALPAVLPMAVALLLRGGTGHVVLALYSVIFLGIMISIARRFNASLFKTWELTFEREDLLQALTHAHAHESALARTDALTGIANRREFDDTLNNELARLQRAGAPLSLILMDVDHFKAYNDNYGHVEGDLCLKKIATAFQLHLHRAPDLAARFGGEEFAGILPETGHLGSLALAERIRCDIEQLAIPHRGSPTTGCITVSLGVYTIHCDGKVKADTLIELADRHLYRAKSAGRNQVSAGHAEA